MVVEEEKKTDSGDAPANGTVSKRRGERLMAFCLSSPHHAGVAATASPFCSAALHTVLCLGCEMAQMLASKLLDVSIGSS